MVRINVLREMKCLKLKCVGGKKVGNNGLMDKKKIARQRYW